MKDRSTARPTLLMIATIIAAVSCGGDGSNTVASGGTSGTGISSGTMTKGSVILNGIHFQVPTTASITIDDQPNQLESELHSGMVVKVRGQINADGTGVAEKIEATDALQGQVTTINNSANPKSLIVLGQTVLVDDLTLYANASGFAGIAQGDYIEVHGQLDLNNNIRASRIRLFSTPPSDIELKGVVSGKTSGTFAIRGLTIRYDNATLFSSGSTFANGDYVEVYLDTSVTPPRAKRIDLEDVEDADFKPAKDEKYEEEGYVSGYSAGSDTFLINGRTSVKILSNANFEDGSVLDLANGIKVEVEGKFVNGLLSAEKIAFKRTRVYLLGRAVNANPSDKTISVLGNTVTINDLTEIDNETDSFSSISSTDRIEVKGFIDSSGSIIAEEVKEVSDVNDIVQARVSAVSGSTLTLLGISADLRMASTPLGEVTTDWMSFVQGIVPASATESGTVVKLEGTYSAGTFAVIEAQIED